MQVLQAISQALQRGDVNGVRQGIATALGEGIEPKRILEEGMLSAMDIIGVKFKNNEIFVPEVLIAARAMNAGMEALKPKLVEAGIKPIGKVVIGTVKGDLHDIGKNMVRMMMEGAGFEVVDLGIDVAAERFVEAVQEHQPDILGMSALLTTTMGEMKAVIDAVADAGLRDQVKIMVGGAPLTQSFADQIGADVYCKNAAEAASAAKQLVL
ncbi:MAG TPA: cobalamin-binding protein [Firmicutes bacterium]|nr:cobalamin-binding protein [Bacillota bacterium]